MKCIRCHAPLPARSDVCEYCGAFNDTDLRRLPQARVEVEAVSARACPRCRTALTRIVVDVGRVFHADRCTRCLGLFLLDADLEGVLDVVTQAGVPPDSARLGFLVEEGREEEWPLGYIPCAECGQLMARKAYGIRSGVTVDRCREHGVWLDGGSLGRLVRWARAGGRQETERVREEQRRNEAQRQWAVREQQALLPGLGNLGLDFHGARSAPPPPPPEPGFLARWWEIH